MPRGESSAQQSGCSSLCLCSDGGASTCALLDFFDSTALQGNDAVCLSRKFGVMGNDHEGRPLLTVQIEQKFNDATPGFPVKVPGRLVGE